MDRERHLRDAPHRDRARASCASRSRRCARRGAKRRATSCCSAAIRRPADPVLVPRHDAAAASPDAHAHPHGHLQRLDGRQAAPRRSSTAIPWSRTARSPGPSRSSAFVLGRPVANFGVAVLRGRRAAARRPERRREPSRRDRRRCRSTSTRTSTSTATPGRSPARSARPPGTYDVVFDSRAATGARFTFRFWVDDVAPPNAAAARHDRARRRRRAFASPTPASGVDPRSLHATVDRPAPAASADANGDRVDRRVRASAAGTHAARVHGLRLPGGEEHGERHPDPPEHARPPRDDPHSLAGRSRSSIVGRRLRSRSTLAANSSLSVRTRRRCEALRRSVRARKACGNTETRRQPRPLRSDEHGDRAREQERVDPAHAGRFYPPRTHANSSFTR